MTPFGRRLRRRRSTRIAPDQPLRPFAADVSTTDSGTLVVVTGEVDIATSPRLRAALAQLPHSGGLLLLDLTAVTFMDSSGLSVVLTLQQDTAAAGERLAVVCPPGPVRLLFEVTGVDADLPLYPTREAALAAQ